MDIHCRGSIITPQLFRDCFVHARVARVMCSYPKADSGSSWLCQGTCLGSAATECQATSPYRKLRLSSVLWRASSRIVAMRSFCHEKLLSSDFHQMLKCSFLKIGIIFLKGLDPSMQSSGKSRADSTNSGTHIGVSGVTWAIKCSVKPAIPANYLSEDDGHLLDDTVLYKQNRYRWPEGPFCSFTILRSEIFSAGASCFIRPVSAAALPAPWPIEETHGSLGVAKAPRKGRHAWSNVSMRDLGDRIGCGSKLTRRGYAVLVHVSTSQGKPFWYRFFEPLPFILMAS